MTLSMSPMNVTYAPRYLFHFEGSILFSICFLIQVHSNQPGNLFFFQQISSYGGQSARPVGGGVPGHPMNDPPILGLGGVVSGANVNDRSTSFGGGRPNMPLPPDASNTLFVEGLPSSCTRREVARIL